MVKEIIDLQPMHMVLVFFCQGVLQNDKLDNNMLISTLHVLFVMQILCPNCR